MIALLLCVSMLNIGDGSDIETSAPDSLAQAIPLTSLESIYKLKKESETSSTSTYLWKEASDHFWKPDFKGYYGSYLIMPSLTSDFVAHLTVYNNENPWYYDNATDIFIQISAYSPEVPVIGSLRIGDSSQNVRDGMGDPEWIYQEFLIYKVFGKPNMLVIFRIEDDVVTWAQMGVYKKDVIENPLDYLDILLKYSHNS